MIRLCGRLAQLVEQLTLNQWVTGSNPVAPTNPTRVTEKRTFEKSHYTALNRINLKKPYDRDGVS